MIHHHYVDKHAPRIVFDPMHTVPPEAAHTRQLLRRMIHAVRYHQDVDGTPFRGDPAAISYLYEGINEAERLLRPHAAGMLS